MWLRSGPTAQLIALTVDGTSVAYAYNNTVTDNYLRSVNLIRRTSTDETEYYLFNAHGDVVTTTNLNGTVNQSHQRLTDMFGSKVANFIGKADNALWIISKMIQLL